MAILAAASILIIISSRSVAGNQPAGINQQESSRRPEIQTQRKRSSKAIAGSSSRQEHSEKPYNRLQQLIQYYVTRICMLMIPSTAATATGWNIYIYVWQQQTHNSLWENDLCAHWGIIIITSKKGESSPIKPLAQGSDNGGGSGGGSQDD